MGVGFQTFVTVDTAWRELLKKEETDRFWWEQKWSWYFKEQPKQSELQDDMNPMDCFFDWTNEPAQDSKDAAFKIKTKKGEMKEKFDMTASRKKLEEFFKEYPPEPPTTSGDIGRFHKWPVDRGGAVVSRPNVFSYKVR